MSKTKKLYLIASLGAFVGIVASFWQLLDKLELLKNPAAPLSCNISGTFNCTHVLGVWQSSVFGFPNSIMCLVFFSVFFTAAVAGLWGSRLSRGYGLAIQGLALFMTAFGLLYMTEVIYFVGAVCIFCLVCIGGLLVANAAWFRINFADMPGKKIKNIKGLDIFIWLSITIYLAASIIFKL